MIVHSGMLNNLSLLSLLIGAKNPKKFQTGRCLNINPTESTVPPNTRVCPRTSQPGYFVLNHQHFLSTLLCICDRGE